MEGLQEKNKQHKSWSVIFFYTQNIFCRTCSGESSYGLSTGRSRDLHQDSVYLRAVQPRLVEETFSAGNTSDLGLRGMGSWGECETDTTRGTSLLELVLRLRTRLWRRVDYSHGSVRERQQHEQEHQHQQTLATPNPQTGQCENNTNTTITTNNNN